MKGKLTYKGQPVNNAALQLCNAKGETVFTIPVTEEGTFSSADVPPGDYKIAVQGSAGVTGPNIQHMTGPKAEEAKAKIAAMQKQKQEPLEMYLAGRAYLEKGNPAAVEKASDLFQQVVRRDPLAIPRRLLHP